MTLIDTSQAIAFQTKRILKSKKLVSDSKKDRSNLFLYTGNPIKNKNLINENLKKINI